MTITTDQTGPAHSGDDEQRGDGAAMSTMHASNQGESAPPTVALATPSRPPGTAALIVACAVLLVVQVTLSVQLVHERVTRSDLEEQLTARESQLSELTHELSSTREHLSTIRAEIATRQTENDSTAASIAVRQIEITELTESVVRMEGKTKVVQDAISRASTVDKEQVRQLLLLTKCLNGIKQANLAAAAGRPKDTVSALKAVADICQQTLAIMSPGSGADFPFDFADPSVIFAAGKYFAYATNGGGGKVQVISSTDLRKWEWVGEALSRLPGWAVPGYTWAPAVMSREDTFYLYYTARHAASGRQCISVAMSKSPAGPFVDDSPAPFVCQLDRAGSIDPSPFVASDGSFYILWKSEGEVVGGSARLWSAKMSDDLKSLESEPAQLVGVDRTWEGRTVEAPSMAESGGKFFLFYSGNRWDSADYATGYAVCGSPTGPCIKPGENVFLVKHGGMSGTGGAEVFIAPGGQTFMSYHAWTHPHIGYPNKRQLHVERLQIIANHPVLG